MKVLAKNKTIDMNLTEVVNFIQANCLGKDMTFDDIRKALKKTKEELPDGHIHQAAINTGFEVSG